MQIVSQPGDSLDLICWRHLGRSEAVTEQALELNPGIAADGPLIPAGTLVTLPEIDIQAVQSRDVVQLWD
ncbi:MAG: tail protein X [Parasphingorhabdus sp.]|nr:tail protein X [Parasphingorhabdus sp.]